MRLTVPLLFILLCFSCTPGYLTHDLSERQAYRMYRSSLKHGNELKISYNNDSSYVLLIQAADIMQGNPCSFVVLDPHQRSRVYTSINKYRDVEWFDLYTLKMKKSSGYIRPNTDPAKPGKPEPYEFYDLMKKEIIENPNTNPEKL